MENNAIETLKSRIGILKENIKRNKEYKNECMIEIDKIIKRLDKSKMSLKECEIGLKILEHN